MNKYFCVAITFWQYVKIGFREFFTDPKPSHKKSFWVNLRDMLISVLIGLAISYFFLWLINVFNINTIVLLWFFGVAAVFDLLFIIAFLFISWRKAVRDCWDKFQGVDS